MVAPYIAYLPTSGCRVLARCTRLFVVNAAKANPQSSLQLGATHGTFADVLVRTTASVDLTTPTCRKVITNVYNSLSRRPHSCANEVNRRVFCTLSEVISRIFSPVQQLYQTFIVEVELPAISWVEMFTYIRLSLSYE